MAIDLEHTIGLIQNDLAPLKITVTLEVNDHVFFVKFKHSTINNNDDYWQDYWGMDFDKFVCMWMRRYFKIANLAAATKNSAEFRLGSLLDFLKNSQHDS